MLETKSNSEEESGEASSKKVDYMSAHTAQYGDISSIVEKDMASPYDVLAHIESLKISDITELIVGWAQKHISQERLSEVLEDFYGKSGKAFCDDPNYHERIDYFFNYFIYERPFSELENGTDKAPIHYFLDSKEFKDIDSNLEVREALYSLAISRRHSLYKVWKIKEKVLFLIDLFTDEKIEIKGYGVSFLKVYGKNAIFQGFLFDFKGEKHLSKGLVFHSTLISKLISNNIKKIRKNKEYSEADELWRLARQQLYFMRHRNVELEQAYSNLSI